MKNQLLELYIYYYNKLNSHFFQPREIMMLDSKQGKKKNSRNV